jgi:plastocyanin
MQRRITMTLAALAVGVLAATVLLGGSAAARGGSTVKVGDDFFSPTKVKVGTGGTVKFKWVGEDGHNVTKTSGPGGSFASETTDRRGVNFTKKFKKAGKYKLICTIHPDDMRMTVKVG